jgi:hypothetical protein
MPSRRVLLRHWASGERKSEADVVARIALDEIAELETVIAALRSQVESLGRKQLRPEEIVK